MPVRGTDQRSIRSPYGESPDWSETRLERGGCRDERRGFDSSSLRWWTESMDAKTILESMILTLWKFRRTKCQAQTWFTLIERRSNPYESRNE